MGVKPQTSGNLYRLLDKCDAGRYMRQNEQYIDLRDALHEDARAGQRLCRC